MLIQNIRKETVHTYTHLWFYLPKKMKRKMEKIDKKLI